MNFGEAKTRAIKLINEYSINGALIPAGNNLDYTLRMPELADDAQALISDNVPIDATAEYVQTSGTEDSYNEYALPADYKSVRFVRRDMRPFTDYRIENGSFIIHERYNGTFVLSYGKQPDSIVALPDVDRDAYVFEVEVHTHRWIPYYISGMVIADENAEISNKLLNIYYEGIAGLSKKQSSPPRTVTNTMRW